MPSADEILEGLTRLANEHIAVALAWHVVVGAALVAIVTGRWRPSSRALAMMSAAPVASVAVLAWLASSPFNAIAFSIATAVLLVVGSRVPDAPLQSSAPAQSALGCAMIAFAWLYPHFLESRPVWIYAVAAPLGVVPCPTLSLVLGIGLCWRGFVSRAWALVIAGFGLFYGLFGVLRLGVWIDVPLIVGSVAMLATAGRISPW